MALYRHQSFIVTAVVNMDDATGDELSEVAELLECALLVGDLPAVVRTAVQLGPFETFVGDET